MTNTSRAMDIATLAEQDPSKLLEAFFKGTVPNADNLPQADDFSKSVEAMIANATKPVTAAAPAPVVQTETKTTALAEFSVGSTIQIPPLYLAKPEFEIKYLPTFVGNKITESRVSRVDLYVSTSEAVTLNSAERRIASISCGIELSLPVGFEAEIRPLFDLASKGILVIPMTFDSRNRGEIVCVVLNVSTRAFRFEPGTRLAQLVFSPVCEVPMGIASDESA